MPNLPTFDRNPLELADEGGGDPVAHAVSELRAGRLRFAIDDPSAPANWPRMLFVWRSNLLGSSGKGQEYFLRHLLGTQSDSVLAEELEPGARPEEVAWGDGPPRGKLDLLVNVDFRMTTTAICSDVVLPAATWYEKYDLSMTDMHPFVHSFNQAIPPRGRRGRTGRRSGRSPMRSRSWRPSTWACGATWSRRRCPTTRRASSPSRRGSSATGAPASARRSPGRRCRP